MLVDSLGLTVKHDIGVNYQRHKEKIEFLLLNCDELFNMKVKYSKRLQAYYDNSGILSMPNDWLIQIFEWCGPLASFNIKLVNKRFHKIIQCMKRDMKIPKWINRYIEPYIKPLPYQFEMVKWMAKQKNGGILNMEQGMGKTSTALLYINVSHSLRNLVLCCKSQMSIWLDEVKKFYDGNMSIVLCHSEYDGDIRSFTEATLSVYDLVVVTYQSAKHLVDPKCEASKIFWNNVICDEVHTLRNRPASMYPYVEKIRRTRFWGLTGSLIFNSISDARNIQVLIDPNSVYSVNNIKKLRFADVSIKLPPLKVNTFSTERTPRQEEIYKRYEDRAIDMLEQLGSHSKNLAAIFTQIVRMRQISVSLGLLSASHSKLGKLQREDTYKSPRFTKIVERVKENNGQSVIFCTYRSSLEMLSVALGKNGVKCHVIRSEQKLVLRNMYIRRFIKGKVRCLLMTYQVGSHGYNLTNANHVVLVSPTWNFAVAQQSFKRVYRLGQQSPVTVDMFATKDSIESRMMDLCTQKNSIEEALFAEHKSKSKLSLKEIKMLF